MGLGLPVYARDRLCGNNDRMRAGTAESPEWRIERAYSANHNIDLE
ncbi:MAG: hypothetical protein V2G42_08400 [bacterium JZ-2024 1]